MEENVEVVRDERVPGEKLEHRHRAQSIIQSKALDELETEVLTTGLYENVDLTLGSRITVVVAETIYGKSRVSRTHTQACTSHTHSLYLVERSFYACFDDMVLQACKRWARVDYNFHLAIPPPAIGGRLAKVCPHSSRTGALARSDNSRAAVDPASRYYTCEARPARRREHVRHSLPVRSVVGHVWFGPPSPRVLSHARAPPVPRHARLGHQF